jgi:hypothetical protein
MQIELIKLNSLFKVTTKKRKKNIDYIHFLNFFLGLQQKISQPDDKTFYLFKVISVKKKSII